MFDEEYNNLVQGSNELDENREKHTSKFRALPSGQKFTVYARDLPKERGKSHAERKFLRSKGKAEPKEEYLKRARKEGPLGKNALGGGKKKRSTFGLKDILKEKGKEKSKCFFIFVILEN